VAIGEVEGETRARFSWCSTKSRRFGDGARKSNASGTVVVPTEDMRLLILGLPSALREGLAESLAGRFFLHRCPHCPSPNAARLSAGVSTSGLYFGGYPEAAVFAPVESEWRQYVSESW